MSDLDPDYLMIDPPSGWQYGFPKRIPREHLHRATEWMIENGYPRHLTEGKYFPVRIGITLDGKRIDPQDFYIPPAPQKEGEAMTDCEQCAALRAENAAHNHAEVKYLVEIDELRAENERLRAALEPLACTCDRPNGAACSRSEVDCPFWSARAALSASQEAPAHG